MNRISFGQLLFCSVLMIILLCGTCALQAQNSKLSSIEQLGWLAGHWGGRVGGVETEEHWLAPKGGMMLGMTRIVREGRRSSFEFLRIAVTTNGVSYFAMPQGRPATEFPVKEAGERKIVFENPKHDFPQRIIYRLEDNGVLHARTEGMINGKSHSEEWRWTKEASR
jgi:hypothetical protein